MNLWYPTLSEGRESASRLFLFPFAGASPYSYYPWRRHFSSKTQIHAIQLPGRGVRLDEAPVNRLEPLINELFAHFLDFLDKPFVFFGHSLGAILAYHLSLMLREKVGREPAALVISGCRSPERIRNSPPICHLPDPEFIDEVHALDGTPAAVFENEDLKRLMLPILRADLEILEHYIFIENKPLSCPFLLLGGNSDPKVSMDDLRAWAGFTSSRVEEKFYEGGHFFINNHQKDIARLVEEAFLPSIPMGEIHVWSADIGLFAGMHTYLASLLTQEENDRALKFVFEKDRSSYMVSRALLRILISKYTGVSAVEVVFEANPWGKLSLAAWSGRQNLRFNLSHSEGKVCFALTSGREVGVDIEFHRPERDLEGLIARFFSAEDRADYSQLPEGEKASAFFRGWVRKEAVTKAVGRGLALGLDHFKVGFEEDVEAKIIEIHTDAAGKTLWTLAEFTVDPAYSAAVCLEGEWPTLVRKERAIPVAWLPEP